MFRASRFKGSMRGTKQQRATEGKRNRRDYEREANAAAAHDGASDSTVAHRCVLKHWTGYIVVTNQEAHATRILLMLIRMGERAQRAKLKGDDSRREDLIIGMDVEFGRSRAGYTDPAAVVQFATAEFVVIIPLEVLTMPKGLKRTKHRAINVRPHLRSATQCTRLSAVAPRALEHTKLLCPHDLVMSLAKSAACNSVDLLQVLLQLLSTDYIIKCGVGINKDILAMGEFFASLDIRLRARCGSTRVQHGTLELSMRQGSLIHSLLMADPQTRLVRAEASLSCRSCDKAACKVWRLRLWAAPSPRTHASARPGHGCLSAGTRCSMQRTMHGSRGP